jgi:hypothetical protein
LQYIVEFDIPAIKNAGDNFRHARTYWLACIQPCDLIDPGDATVDIIEFTEMHQTPIFVHLGIVECSVGRVKTPNGWSISDRSSQWAHTVFIPEDVNNDKNKL